MATSEGPWQNGARIEWVFDTTKSSDGQKATASVQAYLRMDGAHASRGTWARSWSGHWGSGNSTYTHDLSFNEKIKFVTGGGAAVTLTDETQTKKFTATSAHFYGSTTSTLTVTYPARTPAKPGKPTLSRSGNTITLSFTKSNTITKFEYQTSINDGAWSASTTVTGNVTTASFTLSAGNKVKVRVRVISAGGTSPFSDASDNIGNPLAAPSAVTVAYVSDTELTVNITAAGTATGSLVRRKANEETAFTQIGTISGNGKTYTDKTTQPNGRYMYEIVRQSAGGNSGAKASVYAYTSPAKPNKPTVSFSGGNITVTTNKPGYTVDFEVRDDATLVGSQVAMPWVHTGVSRGAHKYGVRARLNSNTSNNQLLVSAYSDYSNTIQVVVPPSAPTNYYMSDLGPTTGLLHLGSVADNGGSPVVSMKYEIRRTSDNTVVSSGTVTPYTDAWVSFTNAAGDRQVRMAVLNEGSGAGWSPWGSWVSFTPVTNVPSMPISFDLTSPTNNSLTASWAAPASLNGAVLTGYNLRLSTHPQLVSDYSDLFLGDSETSVVLSGLQPGTTYYGQIWAYSSEGNGDRSMPIATRATTGTAPTAKPLWQRINGTWRPGNVHLKVGSTWRQAIIWMKIAGSWRKF